MAAPGVPDARVPCPLCGGLIHPVAGRCKHCKQDLGATRAGRPAAATPLPALQPAVLAPAAIPQHREDTPSQPVLPPRPTGRSVAVQAGPSGGGLARHWPMIVIVLAVVAIVGAVTIMVWPEHRGAGSHLLKAPPAPERMDTDPLPPPGAGNPNGADPWSNGANGATGNNAPHSQVVPRSTPDPLPAQPPQQPDDDQFGFGGLAGGAGGVVGGSPDFMFAALGHACQKLKTCPNADDTLKSMCDVYSQFPPPAAPPTCAVAQRCLDAIDNMSCSQSGYGSPLSVVNMFQDCTKAITSC